MTAPVFVVDGGAVDGVAPGSVWTLAGAEARHAAQVQRLRAGEPIEVVDGEGWRLRGEVASAGSAEGAATVDITVLEVTRDEPPVPRLVLVQALAKGGRDEMAIEAATELGVDAVRPWQSERSVVQWRGDKATKGEERWRSLTRAATKVARRSWLPRVLPFVKGAALVEELARSVVEGATVLVLHETATRPLPSLDLSEATEIVLVVGPEGGLSDDEVSAMVAVGGQRVLLGPNVLRSSTAGPAALAALAASTGRWG